MGWRRMRAAELPAPFFARRWLHTAQRAFMPAGHFSEMHSVIQFIAVSLQVQQQEFPPSQSHCGWSGTHG
jgi:hypothetical protein